MTVPLRIVKSKAPAGRWRYETRRLAPENLLKQRRQDYNEERTQRREAYGTC